MLEKRKRIAAALILLLLAACTQNKAATVDSQQTTNPNRFVFVTCWGIWTANQDGSDVVSVISQEELGYMLCPAGLSEDGERVAYWADDGNQAGLWVSDIDSWNPHLVSDDWPPGFEPAGVRWTINPHMVFVVGYGEGQGFYIVDLDTGQRDRWNKLCPSVGVSPRTQQLAGWDTYHYSDDNPTVDVIERDGSHWKFSGSLPSNLISFEECPTFAFPILDWERDAWCWSPNHNQIAVRDPVTSLPGLAIISSPGDASKDLIVDRFQTQNSVSYCAWSPQGQYIAFTSVCTDGTKHCVFVLDLHNREIVWEGEGYESLYWSPDGKKLLFTIDMQISLDYKWGEPPVGVWSLDLDTFETSRILATPVEAFAWRTASAQDPNTTP